MRVLTGILAAYLLCGCVAGSTIPHEDSPAAVSRESGPTLCYNGTTPPCNDRD